MAGSDDDENIMADSQPANDEAGPESVRAGDANSNPDHKVIY
jgi:hypothetical protein